MEMNKVIDSLKKEAQTNPASNAAFHVFALRKRSRNTVVLSSFYHKMRLEGFNYTKADYVPLLRLLASLEFGTLDVDSKGRIRGLKNIRTTLQSIGAAACGQTGKIVNFRPRNKFTPMVSKPEVVKKEVVMAKVIRLDTVSLTASINGKPIQIPVPENFTSEEIATLIGRLQTR